MSTHSTMLAVFTVGAIALHAIGKNKGSAVCTVLAILTLLANL